MCVCKARQCELELEDEDEDELEDEDEDRDTARPYRKNMPGWCSRRPLKICAPKNSQVVKFVSAGPARVLVLGYVHRTRGFFSTTTGRARYYVGTQGVVT